MLNRNILFHPCKIFSCWWNSLLRALLTIPQRQNRVLLKIRKSKTGFLRKIP